MSTPAGIATPGQPDPVAPLGIRLVVDFGTVTSRAMVCWPDGRRLLLATGWGAYHWPSGVYADGGRILAGPEALSAATSDPDGPGSFCRDLKSVLTQPKISLGAASLDPVAGLAALLARLAQQAQQLAAVPVTDLTVTTPAAWGPRHRTAVRAAAAQAGLPEPRPIPTPIAAAWLLTATGQADLPPGSLLLVCDFGYAAFEASLLVRATSEFLIQATARVPEAGGHAVDAALADYCLAQLSTVDNGLAERLRAPQAAADRRDRAILDANIRTAGQTLAAGKASQVLVPHPYPPVPVSPDQYAELVAPIAARCAQTAAGVVDAAGIDPVRLVGVYPVGGSATDTALDALGEHGLAPTPVPDAEFVAVTGAATTPAPGVPAPAAPGRLRRLHPAGVVGTVVAGVCSLALIGFAVYSTTVDNVLQPSYATVNWGEYAMACCCALLAATAAAQTPTRPPPARKIPGRIAVPRLVSAAAAGLVVCVAYAAIGTSRLGMSWYAGSYLRWALLPALPIAAFASLAGLLQQRYPREAARAGPAGRRRWFPIEATAAAAAGMIAIQLPLWGPEHPWFWNTELRLFGDAANTSEHVVGRLGAILIGVGIALAATTTSRLRILTVPIGAAIAGIVPEFDLTTALGVAFVVAASLWWAARAGRLAIATAPRWRPRPPHAWQPPTGRPAPSTPTWTAPPDGGYPHATAYPTGQGGQSTGDTAR